ncbi:MAG TPA: hypothetical protein VFW07_26275 [Parafilimonas sp.]|nr:hypothetical protein [Parafilimonas sp.]
MSFFKQFFIFLALISLLAFIDCVYLGTGTIGIDDGNIFLNYARHIAHGHGFVFNTNGEKVEGFTSLLWVLICAAAYMITVQPELLLICLSLLLTTLVVTNIFRAIKKDVQQLYPEFSKYFFWIYCTFIITIGPSFIAWSVLSLMENALWNFIFISLVLLVSATVETGSISIKKRIAIIGLGCLLILTRPEALVWNLVFTTILFYTFIQNKRKIFYPLLYLLCVAVTTICLTVFRLHYFGYQFPNTYYAKISSDKIYNLTEGVKYAINFVAGYQPVISLLLISMMIVLLYGLTRLKLLNRNSDVFLQDSMIIKKSCIIAVIVLVGFVLPFTTGGDHFGGFRFYQDLLPLFAWGILMIVWLVKNNSIHKASIKTFGFSVIIIFFIAIGLNDLIDLKNPAKTQLNFEFLLARQGRDLAEKLNKTFPSNKPSIGMIAVGGFGLKYQGNTVDLMGLNNILMGHSPGDRKGIKNHAAFNKDIFYKLKPDILLPAICDDLKKATNVYFSLRDENNFDNLAMKNIFNDEEFQKLYIPVFITDKKNNISYSAFAGVDFIKVLEDDTILSIQRIN